jgi:hypothetical protein
MSAGGRGVRVLPDAKQVKNLPGRLSGLRPIPAGWRLVSSAARSPPASWRRRRSGSFRLYTGCRRDLADERTRETSAERSYWNQSQSRSPH